MRVKEEIKGNITLLVNKVLKGVLDKKEGK